MAIGAIAAGLGVAAAQAPATGQLTADPVVAASDATHLGLLSGDNEIPPVEGTASGTAWVLLDASTSTVSWTVEYAGLTGPATGAHFHGPAGPDANAGVVLSLVAAGGAMDSPIQGTAQLTAEQTAQIVAGEWYVNVHTAANPG
ncbi:MAG: CHRD domain-containing protein, partial [Bauldia sp.]|nr:CHRD domain-containing protein [Bauldia sp.]